MHRDEERFLAVSSATPSGRRQRGSIRERGPDFKVLPGNVLIWKHGRTFSHGAIVSSGRNIIHASFPARLLPRGVRHGRNARAPADAGLLLWGA
jgi:hypothetical protein